MATPPLFVNRVNVAVAQDTTMIIIGAPAGPVQDGKVGSVEVARLVMSHQTFKDVAALFAAQVKECERVQAATRKAEQNIFSAGGAVEEDDIEIPAGQVAH